MNGVLLAPGMTRLLADHLYDGTVTVPLTFAGVSGLLWVAGREACLVSVLRAMRADPAASLRGE